MEGRITRCAFATNSILHPLPEGSVKPVPMSMMLSLSPLPLSSSLCCCVGPMAMHILRDVHPCPAFFVGNQAGVCYLADDSGNCEPACKIEFSAVKTLAPLSLPPLVQLHHRVCVCVYVYIYMCVYVCMCERVNE